MKHPGENEVARGVCPVFDWRTNTEKKTLLVTPVGLQIEVASSHQTWLAGKSPVTWQVRWENQRTKCGIFQPCLNTGVHTRFGRSSYIIWAYIICIIYPIVSCSMPTITS